MRIYISASETYLTTPPAQLVCLSIIGINALVFLAWKIPRLENTMRRFWMHWPVGGNHRVVTLATAIFSHQSLPHFAFNSLALYSFGSAAYAYLADPEDDMFGVVLPSSTTAYHFLAFFLTAGLFSSLSSHLSTVLVRLPRLLRDLKSPSRVSSISALAANQAVLPSLGASGAIYATLTLTALAFPDASISLIFVPWVPIPIGAGMAGMIAVDLLGMIRGWK
jgi:rhomboid-like protein